MKTTGNKQLLKSPLKHTTILICCIEFGGVFPLIWPLLTTIFFRSYLLFIRQFATTGFRQLRCQALIRNGLLFVGFFPSTFNAIPLKLIVFSAR